MLLIRDEPLQGLTSDGQVQGKGTIHHYDQVDEASGIACPM